jgi:hypothetical protein
MLKEWEFVQTKAWEGISCIGTGGYVEDLNICRQVFFFFQTIVLP